MNKQRKTQASPPILSENGEFSQSPGRKSVETVRHGKSTPPPPSPPH